MPCGGKLTPASWAGRRPQQPQQPQQAKQPQQAQQAQRGGLTSVGLDGQRGKLAEEAGVHLDVAHQLWHGGEGREGCGRGESQQGARSRYCRELLRVQTRRQIWERKGCTRQQALETLIPLERQCAGPHLGERVCPVAVHAVLHQRLAVFDEALTLRAGRGAGQGGRGEYSVYQWGVLRISDEVGSARWGCPARQPSLPPSSLGCCRPLPASLHPATQWLLQKKAMQCLPGCRWRR